MGNLDQIAKLIAKLVRTDGYVLIEVPNFSSNLDYFDYSLWEEHVNYFTIDTLRFFLSKASIEIIHNEIIQFSGEGLFVIGKKVNNVNTYLDYVGELQKKNFDYSIYWPKFKGYINNYLAMKKEDGKKIAVYGAGSRVFCLINFTGISSYIDIIVDDQTEKQNKFMTGGKITILSSNSLYSLKIDICLLGVNTENEEKVIGKHNKWIREGGVFYSILPPSTRLLPVW